MTETKPGKPDESEPLQPKGNASLQCISLPKHSVAIFFCIFITQLFGYARAAETLDRVVASIGGTAITASDVENEYRFERFLDAQWPPPPADAATLDAVRHRLAFQEMFKREEIPGSAEKQAAQKVAAERCAALRKQYGSTAAFSQALHDLRATDAEVLERITQQELVLQLINQRLRPEALPNDEDVANYYRYSFAPEFQKQNHEAAPPPLSEVADQIREILIQKRINELLEKWIEDLGPTAHVRFH